MKHAMSHYSCLPYWQLWPVLCHRVHWKSICVQDCRRKMFLLMLSSYFRLRVPTYFCESFWCNVHFSSIYAMTTMSDRWRSSRRLFIDTLSHSLCTLSRTSSSESSFHRAHGLRPVCPVAIEYTYTTVLQSHALTDLVRVSFRFDTRPPLPVSEWRPENFQHGFIQVWRASL